LFFQDEGRFGRIDKISNCWVPPNKRATVGSQIIRQYTYAYTAVCPETGENFSLILPYANENCMDIFMQQFSEKYKDYRVIMAMDGASWHTGDKAKKWDNIVPLFQPPYSPELNPAEQIWHHIREKNQFKNTTFKSMEDVTERLIIALNKLDEKTVKSITSYNWIINALIAV